MRSALGGWQRARESVDSLVFVPLHVLAVRSLVVPLPALSRRCSMIWFVLVGAFGALGVYFYKRLGDDGEPIDDDRQQLLVDNDVSAAKTAAVAAADSARVSVLSADAIAAPAASESSATEDLTAVVSVWWLV